MDYGHLVVAVIDSKVDLADENLRNKDIEVIGLEEQNKYVKNRNYHGTAVCNYIYSQCEDVKILSIEVLNYKNKSSVQRVIEAIEIAIKNNVDVINLSLGTCIDGEKIKALKEVCDIAEDKGIIIFSAHNNQGKKAYPASFSNVIGIDNTEEIKEDFIRINKKDKNIIFSKNLISINHSGESIYKIGNSFLCAYVVGIFLSYVKYFKLNCKNANLRDDFLDFMESLNKDYKKKIFNIFEGNISEKRAIIYHANKNNISKYNKTFNIAGYYDSSKNFEQPLYINEVPVYKTIDEVIKNCEIIIVGDLESKTEVEEVKDMIYSLKNHNIDIFMEYGYINTFNRYIFAKGIGCSINCQHL